MAIFDFINELLQTAEENANYANSGLPFSKISVKPIYKFHKQVS
jgi:hypothetical protein